MVVDKSEDITNALDYHSKGARGKISIVPTKPCNTQEELSMAYSPGVAYPCLEIKRDPININKYTTRSNLVGVITDGSAVLGLGNIGPLASKPVMEGKAVLFKRFANIDAFDIEVDSSSPDDFIKVVKSLEPTFGAINLEDIRSPECFYIEKKLKSICNIPIMHDDQHGTAIITSVALINALELNNIRIEDAKVVFCGAGAAAIASAELFLKLGIKSKNLIMCDKTGVLYKGRGDCETGYKSKFVQETSMRTLSEAVEGRDVFVGLSCGNVLTKDMLKKMSKNPIVMALANPTPEIDYNLAYEVNPNIIMATGRSDYPNQVNNVLGFPYIFRGALDVAATTINYEMKIAAVKALVELTKLPISKDILYAYKIDRLKFGKDYIIPKPLDGRLLSFVSHKVAEAAINSGVALNKYLDIEKYKNYLLSFSN